MKNSANMYHLMCLVKKMINWLKHLMKRNGNIVSTKENVCIREGVAGCFHYHLAIGKDPLCGNKDIMLTGLPLNTWGMKTELKESYCKACESIAIKNGILNDGKWSHY